MDLVFLEQELSKVRPVNARELSRMLAILDKIEEFIVKQFEFKLEIGEVDPEKYGFPKEVDSDGNRP